MTGSNFDERLKEPCMIKNSLFIVRQQAADAYATAIAELAHNIGVVPTVEYATLSQAAEAARNVSRKAQANVERHMREHGCDDAARRGRSWPRRSS
jgi:Zn finger protein HypA/HybF involved in hydrogenase expression